jgi:hypothetical protein
MGCLKPRHISLNLRQLNAMLKTFNMELLIPDERECVLRDAFGRPHV